MPSRSPRSSWPPLGGILLLVLSFCFFAMIGPFYAALPIHVADDMRAPATVLVTPLGALHDSTLTYR